MSSSEIELAETRADLGSERREKKKKKKKKRKIKREPDVIEECSKLTSELAGTS